MFKLRLSQLIILCQLVILFQLIIVCQNWTFTDHSLVLTDWFYRLVFSPVVDWAVKLLTLTLIRITNKRESESRNFLTWWQLNHEILESSGYLVKSETHLEPKWLKPKMACFDTFRPPKGRPEKYCDFNTCYNKILVGFKLSAR